MKAKLKAKESNWWEDPRLEKAIRMLHTDNPKCIALPNDGSDTDWVLFCTEDSKAVQKLAKAHGQTIRIVDQGKLDILSSVYDKAPVMYGATYKDTPKKIDCKEKWVMYSGELVELFEGLEARMKDGSFFD
jgi:hypothetical protein